MPATKPLAAAKTTADLQRTFFSKRASLAEKSRRSVPGDPDLDRAKGELMRIQEQLAGSAVLDFLSLQHAGADPADCVRALGVRGTPIGVVLLAACNLLGSFVSASDQPAELLTELRNRVTNEEQPSA